MANSVRIELDSDGIQNLLKSEELATVCEREAQRMTLATGMDYAANIYVGRYRVNAVGYREGDENDG